MFYRFKKKTPITGIDENGLKFDIETVKGDELSDDTFKELSNGRGEDDVE